MNPIHESHAENGQPENDNVEPASLDEHTESAELSTSSASGSNLVAATTSGKTTDNYSNPMNECGSDSLMAASLMSITTATSGVTTIEDEPMIDFVEKKTESPPHNGENRESVHGPSPDRIKEIWKWLDGVPTGRFIEDAAEPGVRHWIWD